MHSDVHQRCYHEPWKKGVMFWTLTLLRHLLFLASGKMSSYPQKTLPHYKLLIIVLTLYRPTIWKQQLTQRAFKMAPTPPIFDWLSLGATVCWRWKYNLNFRPIFDHFCVEQYFSGKILSPKRTENGLKSTQIKSQKYASSASCVPILGWTAFWHFLLYCVWEGNQLEPKGWQGGRSHFP